MEPWDGPGQEDVLKAETYLYINSKTHFYPNPCSDHLRSLMASVWLEKARLNLISLAHRDA